MRYLFFVCINYYVFFTPNSQYPKKSLSLNILLTIRQTPITRKASKKPVSSNTKLGDVPNK